MHFVPLSKIALFVEPIFSGIPGKNAFREIETQVSSSSGLYVYLTLLASIL